MSGGQNQSQLFPLLLVNFIGTLGFSIVLPFLVFLVKDFGGNAIVFGMLSATYPAFQLIGAPILGRWSDVYGRKRILLLSNGGTLVGWIFFLFVWVHQGVVQAAAGSVGSLASIIGLTIGGLLYNLLGGITFLISAGVIFTVFIMSLRLLKNRNSIKVV